MDYFQLDQDEKAQKQVQDLKEKYNLVFKSEVGREVLADILINFCNFGSYLDSENKEEIGQYNVGIKILGRMNVFSSGGQGIVNAEKIKDVINRLI